MKKLLLGSITLLALTVVNAAIAAGLPVRPIYSAPAPLPVFSWTGFYVGVQGGYSWTRDFDDEKLTATGAPSDYTPGSAASPDGTRIGGYLGYNWQVSSLVLGLEADGEFANAKDSTTFSNTGSPPDFYETTIRSQGALRGRVGFAFDRLLLYATGGVALADIKEHDEVGATGESADNSTTRSGWTVGSGLDFMVTNKLIGRIEYRYADFGTFSYTPVVFPDFTENHSITENTIYVGLAYKF
jgi:outer membrane immunogenic protein